MTRQEAYELTLVALCIWREARTESDEGLIAVGCVIRERVFGGWPGSAWWGDNWVEVVTKKWQFSSMTANDDPQLGLFPKADDPIFLRCLEIAEYVMSGELEHPAPTATHYFADYIPAPGWTRRATFIKKIGHHLFYHLKS